MGLTNEQAVKLNGKILCGDAEGQGVLIDRIQFAEETFGKDKVAFRLEVKGEAAGYLNNEKDQSAGATLLDEPLLAMEYVDLEAKDRQPVLDRLNRTFGINPPLVDSDDTFRRLVEGGDAHDQIVGKRVYFAVAAKETQYGPRLSYFLRNIGKREAATNDTLDRMLAKIKARQQAKDKAEAEAKAKAEAAMNGEAADLFGG